MEVLNIYSIKMSTTNPGQKKRRRSCLQLSAVWHKKDRKMRGRKTFSFFRNMKIVIEIMLVSNRFTMNAQLSSFKKRFLRIMTMASSGYLSFECQKLQVMSHEPFVFLSYLNLHFSFAYLYVVGHSNDNNNNNWSI